MLRNTVKDGISNAIWRQLTFPLSSIRLCRVRLGCAPISPQRNLGQQSVPSQKSDPWLGDSLTEFDPVLPLFLRRNSLSFVAVRLHFSSKIQFHGRKPVGEQVTIALIFCFERK
jgi:hypothetical protein